MTKLPGRREIEVWFDAYVARAGNLVRLEDLTPEKLYTLIGSNLGWYWDVEDVGLAPCPRSGTPDAFSGLYVYLDRLLKDRISKK